MGDLKGILLVDLTKCSEEQKDNLAWLEVAQVLDGKSCPVCGITWHSREDAKKTRPKFGYSGDYVCDGCWDKYVKGRTAGEVK